ncbi:MAG: ABC transporter ATP-binding protein [Deltaproteobacteria bacterium]|nr:ABC transporter ATP-binding protein [Deltaproteobacteria bacterium]
MNSAPLDALHDPSTAALRVDGLSKRYGRRSAWALDSLTCHVPRGVICGLVGPNGAGKTTLYSVISGFLPQEAGTVDILGEGPFDPWRLRGRLGVLPQDAALDERLTCREFLLYMGALQGLSGKEAAQAADVALDEVNLTDRARDRIASLSHGMRRRLSAASALLAQPELVLLDEPMAGLDPVQAASLREVLVRQRGRGTLVVSSHNLVELERICDWVILLEKGKLVQQGTVAEVTGRGVHVGWTVGPGLDAAVLASLEAALPGHTLRVEAQGDGALLHQATPPGDDLDASAVVVARVLAAGGVAIRGCQRGRSLEESFLERL